MHVLSIKSKLFLHSLILPARRGATEMGMRGLKRMLGVKGLCSIKGLREEEGSSRQGSDYKKRLRRNNLLHILNILLSTILIIS